MKNLLKYGLVVLVIIASTGLLWADDYKEIIRDTVIVPCENETIVVKCSDCCALDSLVQNNIYLHNTISPKESKDTACWYVKCLKHIKEYKSEYMVLVLLLAFVINIFLSYDKKKKHLIRWILLVAIVAVLSDSSWCYLVLMALLLLFISEDNKELIGQIGRVIATLQGKNFKTEPATQGDMDKNELEHKKILEAEIHKIQQALATQQPVEQPRGRKIVHKRVSLMESSGEYIQKSLDYTKKSEEKIIAKLCQVYPKFEDKRVVVVDGKRILLDGFIQSEHENIIVEVRYVHNMVSALKISGLQNLLEAKEYIQKETRLATSIRVFIITSTELLKQEVEEYYSAIMKNNIQSGSVYYSVYAFDELDKIQIKEPNITEDFKVFMNNVDWNELNTMEQLALYEAAHGELNERGIPFAVEPIPDSSDVKISYIDSPVALRLKDKDKKIFPRWLEGQYMNGEDGYSYLGFREAMEKND